MKTIKWLDQNFERVGLMSLLSAISCLLMFQIIMRYCFSNAMPWAEELARYGFVASAYLCMSYCIREGLLFRIDALFNRLPAKFRRGLDLCMWLTSLAFFGYLAYQSVKVLTLAYDSEALSPALGLPVFYLYGIATMGFTLTTVRILQHLLKIIRHEVVYDDTNEVKIAEKGA